MSILWYEHISATSFPPRFKQGAEKVFILDCRFRRQPGPYDPEHLANLYKQHYFLFPALGTQNCVNADGGLETAIDWRAGLVLVQAALTPMPLYMAVLCDCVEVQGRCHRLCLATLLAEALGVEFGGRLP